MRALQRLDRARMEGSVGPDERPIEVRGDDADAAGEVVGKTQRPVQPFGLPPVAFTT